MKEAIDRIMQLIERETATPLALKAALLNLAAAAQSGEPVSDEDWMRFTPEMRNAILLAWAGTMAKQWD
jgi:hypothetical protein